MRRYDVGGLERRPWLPSACGARQWQPISNGSRDECEPSAHTVLALSRRARPRPRSPSFHSSTTSCPHIAGAGPKRQDIPASMVYAAKSLTLLTRSVVSASNNLSIAAVLGFATLPL